MLAITVYKLDEYGREVWRYPATILEQTPNCIRLEAYFNRDDLDLGFATFKRGDRFVEYFYGDRWYNIFAVYDRDDQQLKGWYCNVCRPAIFENTAVRCEDLALDVWATVKGDYQVLDEEEFSGLILGKEEQKKALKALAELINMAEKQLLPS